MFVICVLSKTKHQTFELWIICLISIDTFPLLVTYLLIVNTNNILFTGGSVIISV